MCVGAVRQRGGGAGEAGLGEGAEQRRQRSRLQQRGAVEHYQGLGPGQRGRGGGAGGEALAALVAEHGDVALETGDEALEPAAGVIDDDRLELGLGSERRQRPEAAPRPLEPAVEVDDQRHRRGHASAPRPVTASIRTAHSPSSITSSPWAKWRPLT